MNIVDSYQHKGLRQQLVEQLKAKGITDRRVLDAIGKIPRHAFMDNAFLQFAYQDKAFPIDCEQTISQPYTVAYQTQLLDVQPRMKVLEIGTGSGYQTSVLCEIGAKVFSVERHRPLHLKAKKLLQGMKYRADLFYGDGYEGLENFAPFDRIIVTAGAPFIPQALKDQLAVGGHLVIPVGESNQEMKRLTKISETEFEENSYGDFSFVPLVENRAK